MDLYPPTPAAVPADLTTPSTKYRVHVVGVLFSLVIFAALYLGMIAASLWLVYRTLISGPWGSRWGFILWIGAVVAAAMLFAFLLKGLFKRRKMDRSGMIEVTVEEQPELFAFIEQLCRDTGAPRPKRVYLTHEVNAAVFYDSSFLSLFLPVRKNLLIGLGLVNVLTLDELKAVLAHEFGHFSQSTMRLGSYVYVASSVMEDMIYGRDKWDELLRTWQNSDFRIAIFGWLLGAAVWVIRKFLALVFMGIHLVNAALTRQMEFHADSVAVSVSGSDSLVRALSRLVFADQSLALGASELAHAGDHGLYSDNLFVHQLAAADHLRAKEGDPTLGVPPDLPDDPTQTIQVFDGTAHDAAPSMWATHPPNHEREASAKRTYIRSVLDDRPAWSLFVAPREVQKSVTTRLYQTGMWKQVGALSDAEEVQQFIDAEHQATQIDGRWRDCYTDRHPRFEGLQEELEVPTDPEDDPRTLVGSLLGDELTAMVRERNIWREEVEMLTGAMRDGSRHLILRGRVYDGTEASKLLQEVLSENEKLAARWNDFDRAMLQAHRALARQAGLEAELVERYRFFGTIQRFGQQTQRAGRMMEDAIAMLMDAGEPTQQEVDVGFGNIAAAWDLLQAVLDESESTSMVELPNMRSDASLREFLFGAALVPRALIEARNLDGMWIQGFFNQVGEIGDKLFRLEQKAWASIVRLHERVAE